MGARRAAILSSGLFLRFPYRYLFLLHSSAFVVRRIPICFGQINVYVACVLMDVVSDVCIRKAKKALSPRFVETVEEPSKYLDGQGLYLRVIKNGTKQWVQRTTIRGKRCELGPRSPPVVSLAVARKLALENRGRAMLGEDPLAETQSAKIKDLTFRQCVD